MRSLKKTPNNRIKTIVSLMLIGLAAGIINTSYSEIILKNSTPWPLLFKAKCAAGYAKTGTVAAGAEINITTGTVLDVDGEVVSPVTCIGGNIERLYYNFDQGQVCVDSNDISNECFPYEVAAINDSGTRAALVDKRIEFVANLTADDCDPTQKISEVGWPESEWNWRPGVYYKTPGVIYTIGLTPPFLFDEYVATVADAIAFNAALFGLGKAIKNLWPRIRLAETERKMVKYKDRVKFFKGEYVGEHGPIPTWLLTSQQRQHAKVLARIDRNRRNPNFNVYEDRAIDDDSYAILQNYTKIRWTQVESITLRNSWYVKNALGGAMELILSIVGLVASPITWESIWEIHPWAWSGGSADWFFNPPIDLDRTGVYQTFPICFSKAGNRARAFNITSI